MSSATFASASRIFSCVSISNGVALNQKLATKLVVEKNVEKPLKYGFHKVIFFKCIHIEIYRKIMGFLDITSLVKN